MTPVCVIPKTNVKPTLQIFEFSNPVGREMIARARYPSKPDIIGFPNLPLNDVTFVMVTRNERKDSFFYYRDNFQSTIFVKS